MSFEAILSSDQRASARFDAACGVMANHFAERGVTVSPAELRERAQDLPALRLACLVDDMALDVAGCAAEITRGLPGVAEQARRAEFRAALERQEQVVLDRIAKLSPTQRMEVGHQLAAQDARVKKTEMTAEEEATRVLALRKISNRALRLSLAREWGLA